MSDFTHWGGVVPIFSWRIGLIGLCFLIAFAKAPTVSHTCPSPLFHPPAGFLTQQEPCSSVQIPGNVGKVGWDIQGDFVVLEP